MGALFRKLAVIVTMSLCFFASHSQTPQLVSGVTTPVASQTQTAPVFAINAKYVNGTAPGYWVTSGTGLNVNISAGTSFCSGAVVGYTAGILPLTASMTNYVFLDSTNGCDPSVKTTVFSTGDIPIAVVVTSSTGITAINDVRTQFATSSLPTQQAHYVLAGPSSGGTGATTPRQLTQDDILPGFSITSFSGSQVVEVGESVVNPVFNAAYSSAPSAVSVSNTDGINSPLVLSTPFTTMTVSGSFDHNTQAVTTFTLSAVGSSMQSAQQTITWLPRTFAGAGSFGATGLTSSGNSAVLTGATGTLSSPGLGNQSSYTCVASGQKCYVLMLGGSHTFVSGGFSFPMNTPTAVTFTNQYGASVSMFLYESSNLEGSDSSPVTFPLNVAN